MSTEGLIDGLVAGLEPVRRRSMRREGAVVALLAAAELGLYVALGFARPDITAAVALPSFWWKLGSLALLSAVGVATALRSFDPTNSPRRGLRLLGGALVALLLVGWLIDAAAPTHGDLVARLMWRHGIDCVIAMVTLSLPAIVALGLLLRRGAPTEPRGSALATGAASAAWGALVFAINCPHDDPLYIAVWYLVGCGIVAIAARLLLPRITRW